MPQHPAPTMVVDHTTPFKTGPTSQTTIRTADVQVVDLAILGEAEIRVAGQGRVDVTAVPLEA
eukprot:2178092-Alexandrium_andersonii.AAC.1